MIEHAVTMQQACAFIGLFACTFLALCELNATVFVLLKK